MGAMKQYYLEQLAKEEREQEGKCCCCGYKLDDDAIECGREMCFECYCERQG
jgi:hypothetical protein